MGMNSEKSQELSARLAIRSPEVRRNLQDIITGLDGFALQNDPQATHVDILVLEIGSNPAAELETIRDLLQEGSVGTLFITSAKATSEILLPALRTGAKEFFQQPVVAQEVIDAFMKVYALSAHTRTDSASPGKQGKIYSVLGAKGGVGTTTFAVNLATNVQAVDKEKMVALIDMNRLVGEIPLFLDLETDFNWEEIGKNINRLDSAYLKSAMVRHSSGIYVVPAPVGIETGVRLPPDFLVRILKAMQNYFDYILIDMGMYLDEESFKVFEKSDAVFLISTLNLPCIINVKRIKESLRAVGGVANGKVRVIANRFEKKNQISLAEASRIINGEISTTIPNDYGLTMKAINNGKVLAEVDKNSSVVKVYRQLAESLGEKAEAKSSRWRFFN
jgi:pilus assembly protein CpaE